jgi:hypothetical protein
MGEGIESRIRDFANQLYTCTPAIVDSYNPEDCTVNVYPAIYFVDKDGVTLKEPFLEKVPLHFQATRELGITFPVRKGDTVLLVFGHSDAELWLSESKDYNYPKTRRQHNINDAYAIAGVFRYNSSPVQAGTEQDLNIRYNDSFVRIKENGEVAVESPTKVTVKAPDVEIESATAITMTAPRVTIDADEIDFGGVGGQGIARIGDLVNVGSGSSAGNWPIVTGSSIGKLL